jgi:hypothetical protein
MRVSLGGVEVALEAESLERVEGGIRLLGKEVRVYSLSRPGPSSATAGRAGALPPGWT